MKNTSSDIHTQTDVSSEQGGRRRFLGVGAKAAPFVLTLASQPALGVQCFTPSRSLSRNTSLTQNGKFGECTGAESPGNYKAQQDPTSKGAYHWPAYPAPSTPFDEIFYQGTSEGYTKFTKPAKGVSGGRVSKTFGEALQVNTSGQVHFHLIGAYLNKMGGNSAYIPDSAVTAQGIKDIWRDFAMRGYYEPVAGVKWYEKQIVDYLTDNGLVK